MAVDICPACGVDVVLSDRPSANAVCPRCGCRLAAAAPPPAAATRQPPDDDDDTQPSAFDEWQARDRRRRQQRSTLLLAVGAMACLFLLVVGIVVIAMLARNVDKPIAKNDGKKQSPKVALADSNTGRKPERQPEPADGFRPSQRVPLPGNRNRTKELKDDEAPGYKAGGPVRERASAPEGGEEVPIERAPPKAAPMEPPPARDVAAKPADAPPAKPEEPAADQAATAGVAKRVSELARDVRGGVSKAIRIKAAEELGKLGPQAKAASRALCDAMLDRTPEVERAAAVALSLVNPPLSLCVADLKVDSNYGRRMKAVRNLAAMQREGAPAARIVIRFMTDYLQAGRAGSPIPAYQTNPDAGVVVMTLMEIAPDDPEVGKVIQQWFEKNNSNPFTRAACATAIGRRDNAKSAVEVLLRHVADPEPGVRVAIINALGELKEEAKPAAKVIRERQSTDTDPDVRQAAARAMEKISPNDGEAPEAKPAAPPK